MTDLVVIVPSRGRPEAAADLMDAAAWDNGRWLYAEPLFVVDRADPRLREYRKVLRPAELHAPESTTMVEALNAAAAFLLSRDEPPFAIGFMGDDHRPRTPGWARLYLDALREMGTGIVYGNDLLQGERIPTQVAMTADIVRALGYMAPPSLTHLFVDNFWKDLGEAAGCLRYLPDVVVEHMHPVAGKADWDEGHRRVNAPEMYQRDAAGYAAYRRMKLPVAVEKVRQLRAAHV